MPHTAAHFAEEAAYLASDNPAYANDAGWACRRCALHERANSWYLRGFQLAVRSKNRYEVIRAMIGRGAVYKELGRYDEARQLYDRASRRALRTGQRRQAAVARHYLFALEAETGSFDGGLEEVRTTLNLYPIYDRRVPYLAHDYAFFLIRNRYFAAALSLLEKLAPAITNPDERVLVESSIAWAAAADAHDAQSRKAEKYVLNTAGAHPEYAAAAFIHLAHASRFMGEWQLADAYATQAQEIAGRRGDSGLTLEATALRQAIAARIPPEGENPEPSPYTVESTAKIFSVRLRRWLAPDRRGTGANLMPVNATDLERRRL